MAKDLTLVPGNPAHTITQRYDELMAIDTLDRLRTAALAIVAGRKGISEQNARKYELTVRGARSLAALQMYLSNFILAAGGLKVA